MISTKRAQAGRGHAPDAGLNRAAFLRPIAHRGWHDKAKGRVENTASAFRAAIDKGYGIECDLQAAAGGTPMVFHDEKLDRLMDAAGPIAAYTPRSLSRFRYKDLDERILTFSQLLDLVRGRVPLLVEVKRNGRPLQPNFLESIARIAGAYTGPVGLMSFDRDVVTELGKLAPAIPRGPVIGGHQLLANLWASRKRTRESPAASRLFGSVLDGIAFYAVDVKLAAVARTWMSRHALDLPLFTWTVRTPRQRAAAARWADAPIFEGYEA